MKNIEAIIADLGIELTDEQKKGLVDGVAENYKPVADWQKQKDKVEELTKSVKETQDALKAFEGVDANALNAKIKELNETIEKNAKDYEAKIADRDFNDTVERAIREAKGKNNKAIMALLDLETLKGSKNQKDDIAKAIETLTTAEDSKMLFGESEPKSKGTGDPIGKVSNTGNGADNTTLKSALSDYYTKN